MKTRIMRITLVLMALIMAAGMQVFAQEEEMEGPKVLDFMFSYFKRGDGLYDLKVNISAEGEDGYYPVAGIPVTFTHMSDTNSAELGVVESDGAGNALYRVSPAEVQFKDTAGFMGFAAAFDGNEEYDAAYEEVYVKDVIINMTLEIVDSVKTVFISAHYYKGDGEAYPINDQDIYLLKQGLLSRLQIGDGWLVDGEAEVIFPDDLPGDPEGNVELYAAITEHDEFGNVEASATIDWGVIPEYITEENGKLWTSVAPTWMIVLLIILLSGVWGHYIFALVQMRKIKKSAPKSS